MNSKVILRKREKNIDLFKTILILGMIFAHIIQLISENENKLNFRECGNNLCCTKIENLSVTKGNNQILKDVNLHIHCGELTALIGPNGA